MQKDLIIVIATGHSVFVLDRTDMDEVVPFGTLLAAAGVRYTSTVMSVACLEHHIADDYYGARRVHDMRGPAGMRREPALAAA